MNKIFDALDLEKQGYKQLLNFFYEIKSEADAKRIPYRLDGSEWKDAIVKKWEMTHMLMEVPVKEGQKILDAGSQNSLFSVMLARLGCEVYPIDINPISMDGGLVLKRQFDLGSKFNPKIADMRSLPFPDEFFDAVFSLSVVEHIPDDGDIQAIQELFRVVKRDGYIGLTIDFYKEFLRGKDVIDPAVPILQQKYWWVQERIYNEQAIWDRIIHPSNCHVVGEIDYNYIEPAIYNIYTMASLVLKKVS